MFVGDVGLGVRKWNKPTNIKGLKFANEAIGDTIHLSSKKVLPEIDKNIAMDKISQYYLDLYERPIRPAVLENLMSGVFTKNANSATINRRLKNLLDPKYNEIFTKLSFSPRNNKSLFIDNIKEYKTILNATEQLEAGICIVGDLMEIINSKQQLVKLAKVANNPKLLEKEFVQMLYNSKPHTVRYGSEVVKVESEELINLLTGEFSSKTDSEFNSIVNSLVEKNHRNAGGPLYYKIAEGILRQKPELRPIALEYTNFVKSLKGDYAARMKEKEKFCNELYKSGRLSKYVDMKTIVPDENALGLPAFTIEYIS